MKYFRKNDGITLIALVITIIVMLILVGVTVSVAMQGGLFGKAREAVLRSITFNGNGIAKYRRIYVFDR